MFRVNQAIQMSNRLADYLERQKAPSMPQSETEKKPRENHRVVETLQGQREAWKRRRLRNRRRLSAAMSGGSISFKSGWT